MPSATDARLVLLPPDHLREPMGSLPASLRLAVLPNEGEVPDAEQVAAVVLSPGLRHRFAEVLPQLSGLELVQTLNAGIDWVPALPADVTLCNASGVHDGPVAEWVLGAILAMEKRFPALLDAQRAATWDRTANAALRPGGAPPPAEAGDLAEMSALIVGHGSIGLAVEARLRPFGTRVTGIARRARPGVETLEALPRLLPEADVVVLLAPATPQTHRLVSPAFLELMKPGALLVNAARGALVDTDALLAALRSGHVRAALDTTDPEPLPDGHPLWSAPGVLITPHVAGSTGHWLPRAYRLVGDQLRRFAAGEPLVNVRGDY